MLAVASFSQIYFGFQNSDLGEDQLKGIELQAQAKNTKRTTDWGVKKFDKWCDKQQLTMNFTTGTVQPDELNKILRKFYAVVKTAGALTPIVLTGLRAAIHSAT